MCKLFAGFLAVVLSLLMVTPAGADRIDWYPGINPPSTWLNLMQQYNRTSDAATLLDLLGQNQTGFYTNLTLTATGAGWMATLNPPTNVAGGCYQYQAIDPLQIPAASWTPPDVGIPLTSIPALATQGFIRGNQKGNSASIGPFTPSGVGGQSIAYLVECQVSVVDQATTSAVFYTTGGRQVISSVNRDRADTIIYQTKASASGVSPVTPTVDAGWVAVASIAVPNGTGSNLSGSTIVQTGTLAAFAGFLTGAAVTAVTAGSNVSVSTAAPTPIISLASPAATACPSSVAGWSATYGLTYTAYNCQTPIATITTGPNLTGGGNGPTPAALALASPAASAAPSACAGWSAAFVLQYATAPCALVGVSKTAFTISVLPTATSLNTPTAGFYSRATTLSLDLSNPTIDQETGYCDTAGSGAGLVTIRFYESFGPFPVYGTANPVATSFSWPTGASQGGTFTFAPVALPTSTTPGVFTHVFAVVQAIPAVPPTGNCTFELHGLQRLIQ